MIRYIQKWVNPWVFSGLLIVGFGVVDFAWLLCVCVYYGAGLDKYKYGNNYMEVSLRKKARC